MYMYISEKEAQRLYWAAKIVRTQIVRAKIVRERGSKQ